MTATKKRKRISHPTANRIKRKWDELQGAEHGVDFERAKLLNEVYRLHERDEEMLNKFMVGVLGEYPGKRTKKFARFAQAFDEITDAAIWQSVGGNGVVLLANVNKRQRRQVMTRVRRTLNNTKRKTVSSTAFRSSLKEVMGDRYKDILVETRSTGNGNGSKAQLAALKSFILVLLKKDKNLRRKLPKDVKKILGVDLVEK